MDPQQHPTAPQLAQDARREERSQLWRLAENPSVEAAAGPDYDSLRKLLGVNVCRRMGIYELPADFVLSVIIPVYNELKTIVEVVRRIRGTGLPIEMVIVDDGSSDGTRDILAGWREQPDMKIIFHAANQGKGAALRHRLCGGHRRGGHRAGRRSGIRSGRVFQAHSADRRKPGRRGFWKPLLRRQPSSALFLALRRQPPAHTIFEHDDESESHGHGDLLQGLPSRRHPAHRPDLAQNRFGIEPELTAKLASLPGVRIHERPISYAGRTYAEGKKITWRDGLRALYCIVRYSRGIK